MDFQTLEKRMSDLEKSEFEDIKPRRRRNEFLDYLLLFIACFLAIVILFFTIDYFAGYFKAKNEVLRNAQEINVQTSTDLKSIKSFDTQTVFFDRTDDYSAKSLVVFDLNSDRTVFAKNADQETFIASLTKMASTKLIADEYSLNETRRVSGDILKYNGSGFALKENQVFTVRDLLKAAVIASNNESIYALQNPQKSVDEMNAYSQILKLKHTNFSNPAGFDDDGQNYSTANEVVPLAKLFFGNDLLLEFSGTSRADIYDLTENKKYRINTTNDLVKLGNEYVIGGKTGTTPLASQNLVLLVEKNNRRYLIIILNSIERYQDAYKVLARL